MIYTEKVLEHFKNPHNQGEIKDADKIGEAGNPKCGDVMKLYLKLNGDVIENVKFETLGCAAAIAVSSIFTDMIKGKTVEQALKIDNKEIIEALGGLPAPKIHCSLLAREALHEAFKK